MKLVKEMTMNYIVVLASDKNVVITLDEGFFNSISECEEYIKTFERIYPHNKGCYKIYGCRQV